MGFTLGLFHPTYKGPQKTLPFTEGFFSARLVERKVKDWKFKKTTREPKGCIFPYMYLIFMVNVGNYTMHGSYG